MGSEHYCLRWNNHQSNLLGVFSQLLHDESLVDVTLACSEGASIRAHKVVLSACSSYFRSLFVEHPARHPIVILKDVGLEELRTLVDFMYKGEVNVQYCQLPALLKTAESLQVKGLAEMTTLTAAGIDTRHVPEPMEECQPQESKPSTEASDRNIVRTNREKDREERIETGESNDFIESRDSLIRDSRKSTEQWEPRDLRDMRVPHEVIHIRDLVEARDTRECRDFREERSSKEPREYMDVRELRENTDPSPPRVSPLLSVRRFRLETSTENMATPTHPPIPKHEPPDDPPRSLSPDEPLSTHANGAQSEAVGLNMTMLGSRYSPVERLSVLNAMPHPGLPHPHSTQLPSPRLEPIAGPSGLPPVQQVPLSLKKEIDWEKSTETKQEGSVDYRLQHESDYDGSARGRCESEGERGGYACIHCGASFHHQSKLARHILTTHTLDTLKYREGLLSRHLMPAFPERVYLPPHEDSPADLDLTLEPGNLVLCKFCGKSFPDVASLISHLPIHTGDRPFKCEFCGKAFKLRHHMKDHCRVHTGERPFRCVLCGKTFSRSTILKAHEKTHYPKYARKFLSPSPVDTEEESPRQ